MVPRSYCRENLEEVFNIQTNYKSDKVLKLKADFVKIGLTSKAAS